MSVLGVARLVRDVGIASVCSNVAILSDRPTSTVVLGIADASLLCNATDAAVVGITRELRVLSNAPRVCLAAVLAIPLEIADVGRPRHHCDKTHCWHCPITK